MTITPAKDEFAKLAEQGNLIPVYAEILADAETPVSAYQKLLKTGPSLLLESVEGGENIGRASEVEKVERRKVSPPAKGNRDSGREINARRVESGDQLMQIPHRIRRPVRSGFPSLSPTSGSSEGEGIAATHRSKRGCRAPGASAR